MKTYQQQKQKLFDKNYPKFKWMIEEYFPEMLPRLESCISRKDTTRIINLMHLVWFHLPDNKFNIIENPSGWAEFLEVLED